MDMDINVLQIVFMWCTIINGAWFIVAAMICAFACDWVYHMQSKWPKWLFQMTAYRSGTTPWIESITDSEAQHHLTR